MIAIIARCDHCKKGLEVRDQPMSMTTFRTILRKRDWYVFRFRVYCPACKDEHAPKKRVKAQT